MVCLLAGPLEGHGAFLVGSAGTRALIVARYHAHTFATMANIEGCGSAPRGRRNKILIADPRADKVDVFATGQQDAVAATVITLLDP